MGMDYGTALMAVLQWMQSEKARKDNNKLLNKEPQIEFKPQPDSGFWNAGQMEYNDWAANLRQAMGRTGTEGIAPYAKSGLTAVSNNWDPSKFSMQDNYRPGMREGQIPQTGYAGAQFNPNSLDHLINNPGQFDRPAGAVTYEDWLKNSVEGKQLSAAMGGGGGGGVFGFNNAGGSSGGKRTGPFNQIGAPDTGDWSSDYYNNGGGGNDPFAAIPGFGGGASGGGDQRDQFGMVISNMNSISPEAKAQWNNWWGKLSPEERALEQEKAKQLDRWFVGLGSKVGGMAWKAIKENPIEFGLAVISASATGGMSIAAFLASIGINKMVDSKMYQEIVDKVTSIYSNKPDPANAGNAAAPATNIPTPGTPGMPGGGGNW